MSVPSLTDKEYREQRTRIRKLVKKWRVPLGLTHWNFDTEYCRVPMGEVDGFRRVATASVKWEYLDALLSFNMLEIRDMDDDRLEEVFVHECCHVLINEMREWDNGSVEAKIRHEERVVCTLTNAFLWVRKADVKKPKIKKRKPR